MDFGFRKNKGMKHVVDLGDVAVALSRVSPRSRKNNEERWYTKRGFIKNSIKEVFYEFEPMLSGAIDETASKMCDNWFYMDTPEEDETIDTTTRDDLVQFHRDIEIQNTVQEQIKNSMIYGNCWLEIVPDTGEERQDAPVTPEQGLSNVFLTEPSFFLHEIEWINKAKNEFYFLERKPNTSEVIKWHNSRLIPLPWYKLGTSVFGHGVYERAFKSIQSKLNKLDWALGEIIYRYGKPFLTINITNASEKEIKQAFKILQKLNPQTGFAGTERHQFDIKNPDAVDPTPFIEFYYKNCAAAVRMPYMIFIGVQKGQLEGSKVDYSGWYSTLASWQRTKINNIIHRINNQYLKGNWNDDIFWNPIFIDEESQLKNEETIAKISELLYMKAGIVTEDEIRQYLRNKGMEWVDEANDGKFEEEPEYPEEDILPEDIEETEWMKQRKLGRKLIREGNAA